MGAVLEFTGRGTRCPSCGEPMQASRSSTSASFTSVSRASTTCFRCAPGRGLVLIQGGRPNLGPMLRLVPRDSERADGLFPDLSR